MAAQLLYFADERAAALRLAAELDVPAAEIERHRFPDAELRLRLPLDGQGALADTLLLYRQRYPDVHVQTVESHTREQIGPLGDGTLDLGLMRNTPLPETLCWQVALREPMLAMVHHSHPLASRERISLRDLASEPFVFFDPQAGTGLYDDILALLKRYGVTPYVTQEVGEAMTILGLVAAGLGVSILPASYRRLRLDEICWLPLEEQDALSELWLVWAKHRELSAPARHFIELLAASNVLVQPSDRH